MTQFCAILKTALFCTANETIPKCFRDNLGRKNAVRTQMWSITYLLKYNTTSLTKCHRIHIHTPECPHRAAWPALVEHPAYTCHTPLIHSEYITATCRFVLVHMLSNKTTNITVESLGLVSPGAATDGCHPIFSWRNLTTIFSHRLLMTFLAVVSSPLPSSHVVNPLFFLNSATKK